MKKLLKTIDVTPKWIDLLPVLIEPDNTFTAKISVRAETSHHTFKTKM